MKLLFSLIVLIFLFVNIVYSESLLSLKTFQYDVVGCNKPHSSSDSQGSLTGGGSFSLLEENKRLGSVDGGGVLPGSESSFESLCDNGELVTETYIRLDTCIVSTGETYSIDFDNGTIKKTSAAQCGEEGIIEWFKPYECVNDCLSSPYMYTIIEMDDIEIPKDTYVEIQYHGDCNNNGWKQNFDYIKFTPLNQCFASGLSSSFSLNCNTTMLEITQSDKFNCLVYKDLIYTDILGDCTGLAEKYINVCNK
ncbi:hypothetical protein ACTFIY_005657 [Dictyostelium cf. discoideum]